jgi:hypothetical protein
MIENFREKYSEHSRIGDMMKSLYFELDQLGEIEETTSAGASSGAFSGPLFGGPQKRNESKVYKWGDLLEGTTTFNSGDYDSQSKTPFDDNKDGWFWNDEPWYKDGEIVDDIAQLDHNWKDEVLSVKMTKENLIKRVTLTESELLDENKAMEVVANFKNKVNTKLDRFADLNLKMYMNIARAMEDIQSGKFKNDREAQENIKNVVTDVCKLMGQASCFLVPGGGISLITAKKLFPKFAEVLRLSIEEKTGEEINETIKKMDETTTHGSVWGVNGPPVTPSFAAKDGEHGPSKKTIWKGGKIVQKIKNSGVLTEINKIKYHEDGDYVKLKDTCTKYKNQPWCNQGAIDEPLILSKTTSENISEVAKKLGISEEDVKKVVINRLSR